MKSLFELWMKETRGFKPGEYWTAGQAQSICRDFNAWVYSRPKLEDGTFGRRRFTSTDRVNKFQIRKWLEKKVGYVPVI